MLLAAGSGLGEFAVRGLRLRSTARTADAEASRSASRCAYGSGDGRPWSTPSLSRSRRLRHRERGGRTAAHPVDVDYALGHVLSRPIHPNYLAHQAGKVLPEGTVVVSESFRNADHLMPFG